MDTLSMYLYLGIFVTLLLMKSSIATGIQENHMFVYHDVVIVESSTTFDRNTRTRLACASLCMRNEDCVALSYQNKTCRIQMSGNMSVIPNVGVVTMSYAKGLALQQDSIVTNSSSNQTAIFGQDGTTQALSLTSTNTANDQSYTTMQFSETIISVNVSIDQSWPNTSPPADATTTRVHVTTRDHVAIDTRSMGTTTGRDVIEDQSSTEATTAGVTSDRSSMESTTHDFVTTVTSTTSVNTSPADISSHDYGTTDATSHGRVKTNEITTNTITSTQPMGTPENKNQTTTQEPVSSTSHPDTTTNVNSWPRASNYYFVNTESTMMEAKIECSSIGGKLLEIENVTKEQYLRDNNILEEAAMSFFWIGAYDENGDGSYEWLSNPTVPMAYTTWNIQEPRRTGTNLCLYSSNNWELRWGSTPCTDLHRFFCEKLS